MFKSLFGLIQKDLDKSFQFLSDSVPLHHSRLNALLQSPDTTDAKYNPVPLTIIVTSFFHFTVLVWIQFNQESHKHPVR